MANHKTTLLKFEEQFGEIITHIVIGPHDRDGWYPDDDQDRRPAHARNKIVSREEGLQILDEEYDNSFGGADCFPFYAWSENYVFTVGEYDGATGINYWPRNPIDIEPKFD